jgi:hypothetical protein
VQHIGIPFQRAELEAWAPALPCPGTHPHQRQHHHYRGGPEVTDYEQIDAGLFAQGKSGQQPDELRDDLAMAIRPKPAWW